MRNIFFIFLFQWKTIPSSWYWDSEHGPSGVCVTFETFFDLKGYLYIQVALAWFVKLWIYVLSIPTRELVSCAHKNECEKFSSNGIFLKFVTWLCHSLLSVQECTNCSQQGLLVTVSKLVNNSDRGKGTLLLELHWIGLTAHISKADISRHYWITVQWKF